VNIEKQEFQKLQVVETRKRVLEDGSKTEVITKSSQDNYPGLEYEAGTTGNKGGDWGHGSRVYLRLENVASVDWQIKATKDKVEIILGGDFEIASIKDALYFMLQTLEEQTRK